MGLDLAIVLLNVIAAFIVVVLCVLFHHLISTFCCNGSYKKNFGIFSASANDDNHSLSGESDKTNNNVKEKAAAEEQPQQPQPRNSPRRPQKSILDIKPHVDLDDYSDEDDSSRFRGPIDPRLNRAHVKAMIRDIESQRSKEKFVVINEVDVSGSPKISGYRTIRWSTENIPGETRIKSARTSTPASSSAVSSMGSSGYSSTSNNSNRSSRDNTQKRRTKKRYQTVDAKELEEKLQMQVKSGSFGSKLNMITEEDIDRISVYVVPDNDANQARLV